MTTQKARRLPRGLKKKLEASLTSLTPRQSGRLWLIYYQEAVRKGIPYATMQDYPPIKELSDALEKRVEEAKKGGGEAYNREAALYNGFATLTMIALEANVQADHELTRLSSTAYFCYAQIALSFQADHASEVARMVTDDLLENEDIPKPVSREDYDRLTDWVKGEALESLAEVASSLREAWLEDHDFKTLDVPTEFIKEHPRPLPQDPPKAFGKEAFQYIFDEEKKRRQLWAEAEGDRLLVDVFKRNMVALEDWIDGWDYIDVTRAEAKAKEASYLTSLVDMLKAGELEGGQAIWLKNCFGLILVKDDCIPAWAALQSTFEIWLRAHEYFVQDDPIIDKDAVNGIRVIYGLEGNVKSEDLVTLAAEFVADCRAKPWGAGLAADVDLPRLARFLVEVENPLQSYRAPDLGQVNLETLKAAEGESPFDVRGGNPILAATARSLNAKAAEIEPDEADFDFSEFWLLEQYYPAPHPESIRSRLAMALWSLDRLRVSHRAFTYRRKGEEEKGLIPVNEFLGVNFSTPLETAVTALGETLNRLATWKMALDMIADEYFDGMPVLDNGVLLKLQALEDNLDISQDILAGWLAKIEAHWPDVDTTSLHLGEIQADPDQARADFERIIAQAKHIPVKGYKATIDLGPEDPESTHKPKGKVAPAQDQKGDQEK